MERMNQVLVDSLYVFVVKQGDRHLEDLVVLGREDEGVFSRRKVDSVDSRADNCLHNLLLLLCHFVIVGVGKSRDLLVRVVWLTRSDVDHHLTFVTDDDETLGVCHDLLDAETITWVVVKRPLDLTGWFTVNELTLIGTDKDSSIW